MIGAADIKNMFSLRKTTVPAALFPQYFVKNTRNAQSIPAFFASSCEKITRLDGIFRL